MRVFLLDIIITVIDLSFSDRNASLCELPRRPRSIDPSPTYWLRRYRNAPVPFHGRPLETFVDFLSADIIIMT